MSTLETILGAVLISIVSGVIGKSLSDHNSVKIITCNSNRTACQALISEKIDHLCTKVEALSTIVNSKLLGL